MSDKTENQQIFIYQSEDGKAQIDVQLKHETVWLSQAQMVELFDRNKRTISEHIGNIFKEGELQEDSVVRKFRIVRQEGTHQVEREFDIYNLDVVILACIGRIQVRASYGKIP